MPERLREITNEIKNRFNNFSANQKILAIGLLISLLIAPVIIVGQSSANWEILYSNLDTNDAAAVVAKLDELKASYKIAGNGNDILVSSSEKYNLRLQLASENVPRGTSGFEIFSESSFGETETDKKVKYLSALQGEISKTIMSLSNVQEARVNLALPEKSLFISEEEPPTASVMVKCKTGKSLKEKEILGIVNLVANSVERLTPENVLIIDEYGSPISLQVSQSSSLDLSDNQIKIKTEFEKKKQADIQTMLDQTFGRGKSVVRVNAEFNFDKVEIFEENYDPEQRVVVSEQISSESSSAGGGTQGEPGVNFNIPEYTELETEQQGNSSESSQESVNYEGDKVQTKKELTPGSIKRLTVAVLIDEEFTGQEDSIRETVMHATGIDENNRNDSVSVKAIKFNVEEQQDIPYTTEAPNPILSYWWVVLIVVGFFVLMLFFRGKKESHQATTIDITVNDEEENIDIESLLNPQLSAEEKEARVLKEQFDKFIDQEPDNVVQTVRSWLREEPK